MNLQSCTCQKGFVLPVELIAMAMALADLDRAVYASLASAGLSLHAHAPSRMVPPKFFYAGQLAQFVNHAMRRGRIKLAGVGMLQSGNVARKLDASGLHAQTDAEIGNLLFARIADGRQHAFDAALAEAAGHQDAVEAFELRFVCSSPSVFPVLRLRPKFTFSFRLCARAPWTRASFRDL